MLNMFEESNQYSQYIHLLETTLYSYFTTEPDQSKRERLWRSLILICNSFATKNIEKKRFAHALGTFIFLNKDQQLNT